MPEFCLKMFFLYFYHAPRLEWHSFISTPFIQSLSWCYNQGWLYSNKCHLFSSLVYVSYVLLSYIFLFYRDLAARNILVFSKNKVKISDFGLSRALGVGKDYYQTNFNVNLKLPIAWWVAVLYIELLECYKVSS